MQEIEKSKEGEVNLKPGAEKDVVKPSKKGKEKVDEAANEFVEVTSEEIFAGCGSIEKV